MLAEVAAFGFQQGMVDFILFLWQSLNSFELVTIPIAMAIGLDPVQFGVMVAVNQEIAQIYPPAGLNLVTVSSISGIPLTRMMVSILPFIAIELVMIYMLYSFSALTLYLPAHMMH